MTSMKIRSWSILSLSILSAVSVFAQQTPQSVAEAELPSLLAGVNNGTGIGVVEVYDRDAP